jgi:hypothetical protein
MPLNSIQWHVKGLIDNLVIPGSTPTLEAFITPPTVDTLDRPKAYVWGARMRGNRQTMPRGIAPAAGFKRLTWQIDVYLSYETNPDSPSIDQEFPLIVDAVMAALWSAPMPVFVTDPTTGLQSQLLAIGEEFEFEYPPEKVPATLRMLYYTSRLGMTVVEAVQA